MIHHDVNSAARLSEEDYSTFFSNMRNFNTEQTYLNIEKSCLIRCEVRFKQYPRYDYFRAETKFGEHAEEDLLTQIEELQQYRHDLRRLKIFTSYSPCKNCSKMLAKFASQHRHIQLQIICTSLYYHLKQENQDGLRLLARQRNVKLRITSLQDWDYLHSCLENPGVPELYEVDPAIVDTWDDLWQAQLDAILQYDDRNFQTLNEMNRTFQEQC